MTIWGAISHLLASVAQLEQRLDRIEDALGALEYGGTSRDPRTRPLLADFYKLRQERLAKEKAPLVAGPEESLCGNGCCYGPTCINVPG
jgi:hypothetical protein